MLFASARDCMKFQWNQKQLFGTILKLNEKWVIAQWNDFSLFKENQYFFNVDSSQYYNLAIITQCQQKFLWKVAKEIVFLYF